MLNDQEIQKLRNKYNIQSSQDAITGPSDTGPGYVSRVTEALKLQGQYAGQSIVRGSELIDQGLKQGNALDVIGGAARAGLGPAAAAVRGAFSPLTEAVSPAIKGGINKVSDNKFVQSFASSPSVSGFLDTVFGGVKKAEEWAKKYPDASRNLIDAAEIAGAVVGAKGLGTAKEAGLSGAARIGQGLDEFGKPIAEKAAGAVKNQPAAIMQRVARISKGKQAKFETRAGESVGEYLTSRGIYGNVEDISKQLFTRFTQSKQAADDALASLPGRFEPKPIKTALTELVEREQRVSSPGALSQDLPLAEELLTRFNDKGLTMSEINQAKRLYEKNIKLDYLKQNLPEKVARANNIDNAIREWQFNQAKTLGLKNLPEINKETSLARQLLDDIGAEHAGSRGNNLITLTDWVLLAGGDPTFIGAFLAKKGLSTEKVQSMIAKFLARNKEIKGSVKADIGPSEVRQLPQGEIGGVQEQINVPIKGTVPYSAEPPAKQINVQ